MSSNLRTTVSSDPVDVAYVTPSVIAWAIQRSGMSKEQVAEKVKVDVRVIEAWMHLKGPHPPFAKAQLLAKVLHIPFGFLYLEEPPKAELPLPDFRGFNRAYRPSSDLLELLNDILVKQDWFRDHEKEAGVGSLKFVNSFTLNDSVADVAEAIRTRLGMTVSLRQSASTWSDYLSILSRRAESAGILVMRSGVVGNLSNRQLDTNELLGFAIADPIAPVVFVNSADYRTSQVFTLAHELAHLWIGQSAIANPDELGVGQNKTEVFCNRVAAEVLVPQREFLGEWTGITSTLDVRVDRTSKRFWVSGYVIARRARELNVITEAQYESIKKAEGIRRRREPPSGGNYYRNVSVRMSPKLTKAVLDDLNRGKLELRDAASLLSTKVPTLLKFAEKEK